MLGRTICAVAAAAALAGCATTTTTTVSQPAQQESVISSMSRDLAGAAGLLGGRLGVNSDQAGVWFQEGLDFKSNPSASARANLSGLCTDLHSEIQASQAALMSLDRDGLMAISRCAGFMS